MKQLLTAFSLLFCFFCTPSLQAQKAETQTIKGQVTDDISQTPLAGVTVSVSGAKSLNTLTGTDGFFRLDNVPVGRQTITISCLGYEMQTLPELLVTSGKQVVLTIMLSEVVTSLKEVTVSSTGRQRSNNEMAVVSNRTFNPDDTRRFAGTLGDPSRMIASGAGVASNDDSRNDIVVRGNSPAGLLWQMEGIDIPNPNHYGSLSSTGGPVSILNNNNLGKSDFYTGAFPAQYGNAIASVFDLRLRNGNSEKSELLGEVSFTGFEAGAEGPFSKKSKASYIVNYRYSTLDVLSNFGLSFGTGNSIPHYQDLNFKVYIPLSAKSKLSVWGIGGPSHVSFFGNDADTTENNSYSNENENLVVKYFTGMAGLNLETSFSKNTFGKLSLGYSHTYENVNVDSISTETRKAFPSFASNYKTDRYSLAYFLSHRFNAKNSVVAGINHSVLHFNLFNENIYNGASSRKVNIDQDGNLLLLQAYAQWKHRFSGKLYTTLGVHWQTLTLNGSTGMEPRFGLTYNFTNRNSFTLGYGLYSEMQTPLVYFYQTHTGNDVLYTNKHLGFTRSQHFVAGYTHNFSSSVYVKAEAYYQNLTKVPVDIKQSGFSVLNSGAGFASPDRDSLINDGTGRNYGIELTLEKTYSRGLYFLITGSLFNSKYKGSDGIERNTAFNTHYITNVLAGQEVKLGKNKNTLSLNIKLAVVGGKYTSPVDTAASAHDNKTDYDETAAPFSILQSPYFRIDAKLGYRINYKKSTLEFGIDLLNLTNHDNIFLQSYNRRLKSIQTQYQQGFLPVPFFRFTF